MARKRVNGTGSVFQRRDGRWVATAVVAGQRRYRYAQNRKKAELKLAARLAGSTNLSIPLPRGAAERMTRYPSDAVCSNVRYSRRTFDAGDWIPSPVLVVA